MIEIYKNLGETPLQALNRLRLEQPELKNEKLSYAGRLDPMAEGVMLVLVGGENKNRNKYLNLSKEYEFEVLFSFSTDTYDLLGLVDKVSLPGIIENDKIVNELKTFLGKQKEQYPPFSSKPVFGKPLFTWAREGKLEDIEIPSKEIEIFDIKLIDTKLITSKELLDSIKNKISKIKGDFRQEDIIKRWTSVMNENPTAKFTLAKIKMHASSGTYARNIAYKLGQKLGIPSLAYSIKRTAYK